MIQSKPNLHVMKYIHIHETTQRMKMARGQIDGLKIASARADLTAKELSEVPDGTRTYESVGRM